jgi:hypothetical protein
MDILNNFSTLGAQIDTYIHPATKIIIPFLGLFLICKLVWSFWSRVLGPLVLGEVGWKGMGDWAVVAGASYGIGGQYAKELAKRGCNLIIIGHDAVGIIILKFVTMDHYQSSFRLV